MPISMPSLRSHPIVVIDDDDDVVVVNVDNNNDLSLQGNGVSPSRNVRSPNESTSTLPLYIRSNPCNHYERTSIYEERGSKSSIPSNGQKSFSLSRNRERSAAKSTVTNLTRDSTATPKADVLASSSRACSVEHSRRVSASPLLTSGPLLAVQKLGSHNQPIELGESDFDSSVKPQPSKMTDESGRSDRDCHYSCIPRSHRRSLGHLGFREENIESDELIDLDNLEHLHYLWVGEEDLQILGEKSTAPVCPMSSRNVEQRNLPVIWPLIRLEESHYGNLHLRASKTVELDDGEFLRVTDIIKNSMTGQITLRGHRLQRCRSMNGLLERKLNEVCFFHEIDLDDPRPPQEQSAIEVPVHKVKGLRTLRRTNQTFPLCRNFVMAEFHNQAEAATEGGLTTRWRYTCAYASAADRWLNNPKERTLEYLREEECTSECGIPDAERRFQWRGQTTLGGAHQPTLADEKRFLEVSRGQKPISICSDNSGSDLDPIILDSCPTSLLSTRTNDRHSQLTVVDLSRPYRKRRPGSPDVTSLQDASTPSLKKVCFADREGLENGIRTLSKFRFGGQEDNCNKLSTFLDVTVDSPSGDTGSPASVAMEILSSSPPSKPLFDTTLPPMIDISCSELATPSPTGILRSCSQPTQGRVVRLDGQMLTYGDAFCGAGGTTRGAAMAGLRVTWGFDFWDHACSSWRTNFPRATCYELSSEEFVAVAQGSKRCAGMDVKVDILHLSPPCQYFSPAHTVSGVGDEMNTASLFAVGPVIKVAKPRIVTLEQTFGIVATRFRAYFNSLIQMFTALNFSVRWAIVPMAQWGLPQRRFRLIIIAACPGEILPKMPAPTHSESDDDHLKPFVTVNHVLLNIPANATDHDPESLTFAPNRCMRPWDGNKILPRAMTTSGGQNYHPSGKRDFTLREYASLQGFPLNHVFKGSYVKKQIGNAVPPCVAKVLFESIKKHLNEVDGIVDAHETMVID